MDHKPTFKLQLQPTGSEMMNPALVISNLASYYGRGVTILIVRWMSFKLRILPCPQYHV